MNLIWSIIFVFAFIYLTHRQKPEQAFNLTPFSKIPKGMPDDIGDCGTGSYYLSKEDERNNRLACITDYDIALIYINNKPLKFKVINTKDGTIYISGDYTLIIEDGPEKVIGDETWTMKSMFILRYKSKIVWTKRLIGYGGC